MENTEFCNKTAATELLMGEKHLANMYNVFLLECATPEMIRCLSELLGDTHNIQQHIFEEMNSRGWYPVTKAPENKIQQTKTKFASKVSV